MILKIEKGVKLGWEFISINSVSTERITEGTEEEKQYMRLFISTAKGNTHIKYIKKTQTIYLLNDEGKTIERIN